MRIQDILQIKTVYGGWRGHRDYYYLEGVDHKYKRRIAEWDSCSKRGSFLDYDFEKFPTRVEFELYLLAQIRNHMMPALEAIIEQG